jgi:hypothetical protein
MDVVDDKASARRLRFRSAIERLSRRAESTELVQLVLLPAAIAMLGGFALMILGWYGASRTFRQIEQVPYLISGGLIGLGLVVVGGLLLATALWLATVRRMQEEAEKRTQLLLEALEDRLRAEQAASAGASANGRTGTRRTTARRGA